MTFAFPEGSHQRQTEGVKVLLQATRSAAALLERIARGSDEPALTPVLICGGPGTGKTHLLDQLWAATSDRKRVHWDATELISLRDPRQRLEQWTRAREADVVIVDDVDRVSRVGSVSEELATSVERWSRLDIRVVGSTTIAPTEWGVPGQRLRERFAAGVIAVLRSCDLTERCMMIRHFSGAATLPAEVVDWLAARVPENLSKLRAATLQLLAVQATSTTQMDVARARVVLEATSHIAASGKQTDSAEVPPPSRRVSGVYAQPDIQSARKLRFKQMLTEAETDDEKRLALEIALGERIRELRLENATDERTARFEQALGLLREGHLEEALKYIA